MRLLAVISMRLLTVL